MKSSIQFFLIALILIVLTWSCKKDNSGSEAVILSYSVQSQKGNPKIDAGKKSVTVTFPENTLQAANLTANFTLSAGATATVGTVPQISGKTPNNYNIPFTFKVKSEDLTRTVEWKISGTNNAITLGWGLGGFETNSTANDKTYEWYLDQFTSGQYKSINCGPTSTTMAAKWSNPSFSKTVLDARAMYRPEGGWWYTTDVDNYLSVNAIPHFIQGLAGNADGTWNLIMQDLDAGKIVILCLDMYYVRSETDPDYRIDKFYNASTTGWGHFIVIKGYRQVDSEGYYEVFDPFTNNVKYSDGTLKGKNRFYRKGDIFNATYNWWNYAIVVDEKGAKDSQIKGLDPASVPAARGR